MIVLLVAAVGLLVLAFVGQKFWKQRQLAAEEAAQKAATQAIFDKAQAAKAAAAAAVPKGPKVSLYFGSQTGTAEGYAKDVSSKLKRLGLSPSVIDLEDIQPDSIDNDTLALFFIATTGEGDPTDNAAIFLNWLKHDDREHHPDLLQRLKFAVFALGNKEYEHYNNVGKMVDEKLVQLGGQRLLPVGLGDDNESMEDDFESWQEDVLPLVRSVAFPNSVAPAVDPNAMSNGNDGLEPLIFPYEAVRVSPGKGVINGGRFDVRKDKRPMGKLDKVAKSYFECTPCRVIVNRELRKSPGADGLGSTMHIEIDLKNSGLEYNSADTLVVLGENEPNQVEALGTWLGLDLDQWFELTPTEAAESDAVLAEELGAAGPLFPMPCTVRTALACYCDVNAVPSRALLGKMAQVASRAEHRKRLSFLASKDGKEEYHQWVVERRMSVVALLEAFPSIQPDLGTLMQLLPRMHAREYTIASSAKVSPTRVHIAVSVVQEPVGFGPPGTLFRGVCSNHLARSCPLERTTGYRRSKERKEAEEEGPAPKWPMLYIGVRKSTFVLPTDPATPLILIGPGTGIAPMRAFLQERRWQRLQGMNPGETHLFFGCRRRDEDFIYEDEVLDFCASGDVTTFQPAFSREGLAKVYVQHRVLEDGENVWRLVKDKGAYVFVCGGAQMGRDVVTALNEVAMHHGNMSETEAHKVFAKMHTDGRFVQELWS